MPKGKHWTPEELAGIRTLHLKGWTDLQIANKFNRTEQAVGLKRNRAVGSFIFCKDCGIQVKNKGGKRLRCIDCATKKNEREKIERAAKWYQENKKLRIRERDRIRFGGMREKAIKRDGEKCLNCAMTREQHHLKFGCDITVDHIDGNGRNSKEQNNNLENLMTLCLSCHGKKDVKRRVQDWSMCAESLKRYYKKANEQQRKSIIELLLEGKTPKGKSKSKRHWK